MVDHSTKRFRGKQVQAGPVSAAEKKAKSLQYITAYQTQVAENSPFVAPSTAKVRERIWSEWLQIFERHCADAETNCIEAWTNFLRNPKSSEGQAPFRAFLRTYVEASVRKTLVLGPEEFVYVRTVDMAFTVQETWRRLVAAADTHVMSELRQRFPDEAQNWRLRWLHKDEGTNASPSYRLVQWIFEDLAPELGLSIDPSYRKIEMTSRDVYVLLETLWSRSSDIPCEPDTRLDFHAFLLLSAIGGFRRGTVLQVRYHQLEVAVVRDPENISQRKIVVSITIRRNKIKKTATTSRLRNGGYIGFSITLVPNRMFCLASLILTRAIQQNAFKAGFRTIDDIFDQPRLESVDFIPLEWRSEFLPEAAFSLSSSTANGLWLRLLLVAGFREPARLYSLRVGAGLRMDGVLTDALRNYVMSHTTGVFQASYQSHNVRADLMRLAFGQGAGQEDCLFQVLRDTSLSRDPNAPIRISIEEEQDFEKRQDVKQLRRSITYSSSKSQKAKLRANLTSVLETLRKLKLEELRGKYFMKVDHLRSTGQSTSEQSALPPPSQSHLPSIAEISKLLQPAPDDDSETRDIKTRKYIRCLLEHLRSESSTLETLKGESVSEPNSQTADVEDSPRSLCLLCTKSYRSRSSLTRHYNGPHAKLFDQEFQCPECYRSGRNVVVHGRAEWSNHVEAAHGRLHAPNWTEGDCLRNFTCPLCSRNYTTIIGLISHINRHEFNQLSWPVECAWCIRTKVPAAKLESQWSFIDHLKSSHLPSICICGLCGYLCNSSSGLSRHSTFIHQMDFEEAFLCAACITAGKEVEITDGLSSWQTHVSSFHSTWTSIPGSCDGQKFELSIPRKRLREALDDVDDHRRSSKDLRPSLSGTEGSFNDDEGISDEVQVTGDIWQGSFRHQSDADIYDNTGAEDAVVASEYGQAIVKPSDATASTELYELLDPALRCVSFSGNALHILKGQFDEQNETEVRRGCGGYEANSQQLQAPSEIIDSQEFVVDCILERWGKDQFLLKWQLDGSCSWVSRVDISEELLNDFEKDYKGYNKGINVLRKRRRNGKVEYRVNWVGRPSQEDCWIREKDMDPCLVSDLRSQAETRPTKRRRHN